MSRTDSLSVGGIVCLAAVLVFAGSALGEVNVVVELVPDNPGPYVGGESLTVDVWLHSEVAFDEFLDTVQLDFADSDPALSLDPTFTFDLSAIETPRTGDYSATPELPVPVVWVSHDGPIFQENMLPLPAGGSLHIGSIGVRLPAEWEVYRLDALNSDEPDELRGALILPLFSTGTVFWRAFTGEITGGAFDFVVSGPPIPTVSEWGLGVMTLLLLVLGSVTVMRRGRSIIRSVPVLALVMHGDTDKALAAFRTALELDPTLTDTRFELGLTYWRKQELTQAIGALREVLTIDPNDGRAHERLAVALYYTGDCESAWRHVHAAEDSGHPIPPQLRPLLESQMPEPQR